MVSNDSSTTKPLSALLHIAQWLMLLGSLGLILSCAESTGTSSGADPGVLEAPIAYVKRPIPVNNQNQPMQTDLREPRLFSQGGDVYIRSNSTSSSTETNISAAVTLGTGDVKGLNASFDGTRLIFSLRLFDPNPNDDVTPSWNIYEYDLVTAQLRRIIPDDLTAEAGDDLFPAYLPDGRIIFSSSRQRKSGEVLSDEGRPRFSALDENENTIALVLHVMNDQGGEIRQVSFNKSHDLYAQVLAQNHAGQIVYSRWDNAGGNSAIHLYKSNPDGSDAQVFYGAHSHATGTANATVQFVGIREMADGRLMGLLKPFSGTFDGGSIVIIDSENFVDNDLPLWSMTGLPGPAQVSATQFVVTNDGSISRNGRYSSVFPLWDGSDRLLVSKSSCQILVDGIIRPCIEPWILNAGAEEQSPAYSIWLYDMNTNTEKVVVRAEQGLVITDAVALQSRSLPPIKLDNTAADFNSIWSDEGVGVINIKSVYDFADPVFSGCFLNVCTTLTGISNVMALGDPAVANASQRPARFVRFVKAVSLPDEDDPTLVNPPDLDNSAFGPQRNQDMREIVGYAAVEPDGSVKVKVPANVPLAIDVLDDAGRRIGPRHQNWIQLLPGHTVTCAGCHTHNTVANATPRSHGRSDALAPSINAGLSASATFANTQIPGTTDAYWGDVGETMAEVRFKRVADSVPVAPQPVLSIDINYSDVWTDPAVRALDASFAYQYSALDVTTVSPASAACTPWTFKCRSVINYAQHIHPLWQLSRGPDADLSGLGDNTCTECHTNSLATVAQVPAAQLDLTDGSSDINNLRLKSYQELFFNDAGETLDPVDGVVNIQIEVPVLDANGDPALDAMGNPITEFIDDPNAVVTPSMSANGARSSYFMEKLTETELDAGRALSTAASSSVYLNHTGFLSVHELRLISEWLDIGAQYFNNPFDPAAPQN